MKRTAKLLAARAAIRDNRIDIDTHVKDQQVLYDRLQAAGWWWSADRGEWVLNTQPQAAPLDSVLIRVWAATGAVQAVADQVVFSLQTSGYKLIDRSQPYQCRPPKDAESRVYLRFLPEQSNGCQ